MRPPTPTDFRLDHHAHDGVTERIDVSGELDMTAAATLGSELLDCLAGDVRKIVLEMSHVLLIDSAAIGVLLSTHRLAQGSGRELVVENASDHVRRVFAITGLERELNLRP
ncbi:MAG TPA: STAS domain-containing protein [Thermoleophilaceae bacterium]